MSTISATIENLTSIASRCLALARDAATGATDDSLLDDQRQLAAVTRLIESTASTLAAEIAHRSRRELGYSGLAQKRGARTPEALVQIVTGSTSSTARRLVRVGGLVADAAAHELDAASPMAEPWLVDALRAVGAGVLSTESLEAIRAGLGTPTESVGVDALAEATRTLTTFATTATVEQLATRARELRDTLDAAGVELREQERRDKRFLRLIPQADGMTRLTGLLDPESAAIVGAAVDAATSPRRGGPRFVDPAEASRAQDILDDSRTTEQLALDALVELVDAATRGPALSVLGARRPDVRVLVTLRDLERRSGAAHLEGQTAAVSIATVDRHSCDGGLLPLLFDGGKALDLGRSQRLHSARQRAVIAARDGGCLIDGCDRPPGWCEVHHIVEFSRGGVTSVDDGVLLCRHHHMLMHNNGWQITRTGTDYWVVPPPEIDATRTPVALRTKSSTMRRLLAS